MPNKIYIGARGTSRTVAVVENNKIIEFNREDEIDDGIVGNIYKGVVENVVVGMQAAFVNIGRERNAYLYCGEQVSSSKILNSEVHAQSPEIKVKVGDEVMVQVVKTESGNKGSRISTNISLAGRYLVYLPFVDFIGISRKIESEDKRTQLEAFVMQNKKDGGYIVRTNSEHASDAEILSDIENLYKTWLEVQRKFEKTKPGNLAFIDSNMVKRTMRDLVNFDTEEVIVDTDEDYTVCKNALACMSHTTKLTLFSNQNKDMFYENGLSSALLSIMDKKVVMQSGAYLIIEHTEALTVIDVNTGKFVGDTNLEDTVFETNMEAATMIANQLRLRKIGGIIIVDFIDMEIETHKEQLMEFLGYELRKDRVKTTLVGMTPLGLVEITRTKTQKEMSQKFSSPCPYCGGRGTVVKFEVLMNFIQTKLFTIFRDPCVRGVMITVAPEVFEAFLEARAFSVEISLYWDSKRIYIAPCDKKNVQEYEIKKFTTDIFDVPNDSRLLV
ncbi:MAG: Rne/Rng family ribonuclease [Bacillota bacterium]